MKTKLIGLAALIFLSLLILNWRRSVAIAYGQFSSSCSFDRACGQLFGIDCGQAADGPYYYVKAWTGEVVSTCGGACMKGSCENCPPADWSCRP